MLSGLYFPALRPDPAWTAALAVLIGRPVCYGVVEGGSAVPGCEVKVVAPLGPERDRFLGLLREMAGRGAEYFKGHLLAGGGPSDRAREESGGASLIAALQGGPAVVAAAEKEKSRNERLWQARLVLELADRISSVEAEINLELAAVNRKQQEMLRALQGLEEEAEPPAGPAAAPRPRSFRVRDLLGAWAVLFMEDKLPEPFLVTDDQEAGELLLEELEKRAPGAGFGLPDLQLPWGGSGFGADVVGEKTLQRLKETLAAVLVQGREEGRVGLADAIKTWNNYLAGTGKATMPLRLHLFPAGPGRRALGGLSGMKAPAAGAGEGEISPLLIGIGAGYL